MAGDHRSNEVPPLVLDGAGLRVAVLAARWNREITMRLLDGVRRGLADAGVRDDDVTLDWVPGAFELPLGAKAWAESGRVDAVICLGCVIHTIRQIHHKNHILIFNIQTRLRRRLALRKLFLLFFDQLIFLFNNNIFILQLVVLLLYRRLLVFNNLQLFFYLFLQIHNLCFYIAFVFYRFSKLVAIDNLFFQHL